MRDNAKVTYRYYPFGLVLRLFVGSIIYAIGSILDLLQKTTNTQSRTDNYYAFVAVIRLYALFSFATIFVVAVAVELTQGTATVVSLGIKTSDDYSYPFVNSRRPEEKKRNSSLENNVTCPYCHLSDMVKMNGTDQTVSNEIVQKYFCEREGCGGFREEYCKSRSNLDAQELARKFLLTKATLPELHDDTGFKIQTMNDNILRFARGVPSVLDMSKQLKRYNFWGYVLGVDTTGEKIEGKNNVHIHAFDVLAGDPLSSSLLKGEDTHSMTEFLREFRDELDYHPILTVSDLDPALLKAIAIAFEGEPNQGCLFHLGLWLNKNLPTEKTEHRYGKIRIAHWRKVKRTILNAAYAANMDKRGYWMDRLLELDVRNDKKVGDVISNFRDNIYYYLPLDQLKKLLGINNLDRVIYNNVCEVNFGLVKDLGAKMKGWKSLDTFMPYINTYYWFKRKDMKEKPEPTYVLPINLFNDQSNIQELEDLGIPREIILTSAETAEREILGNYAFSTQQLEDIRKKILLKKRKTNPTICAVMKKFELDMDSAIQVTRRLGFQLKFHAFDSDRIEVLIPERDRCISGTELDN